jgi:hypothetical protein
MKPGKMRDNLIEHAEMARLSRKLVELACDVPLPDPLDDGRTQGHSGRAACARSSSITASGPCSTGCRRWPMRRSRRTIRRGWRKTRPAITMAMRRWSRSGARPLDRSGAASGLGRDRYRDHRRGCHPRRAGRRVDGAGAQQGVLHPARPRRHRHVRREAGAARPRRGAGQAEAAAGGPGRPQDRP